MAIPYRTLYKNEIDVGKETNYNYPATFDDLIDEMQSGQYAHLHIFLYRDEPKNRFDSSDRYLVVNNWGLGLYKLINLDYKDGKIQLEFTNPENGNPATVNLNINTVKPDILVINSKDIADLAIADKPDSNDDLLELDNDG